MSTFFYELREFSAESSFNWEIQNCGNVEFWRKYYSIKSAEIDFKEAKTSWFIKLKSVFSRNNYCFRPYFYIRDNIVDENSRFKFEILMNDGTSYHSTFFTKFGLNVRDSYYEYELPSSISITDKCIQITPKVTFETLKYYAEEPESNDDDFDHLSDAVSKSVNDVNEAPCCSKKSAEKKSESGSDSDESISCDTPNCTEKEIPITEMNDMDLSRFISKIYLGNMELVADTSSNLIISAAKDNHKELLTDCSKSLAAQMNFQNFMDIWDIAERLNIDELKRHVIHFVVSNRGNIRYDGRMSPDLLRGVVTAMDLINKVLQ